MSTDLNFEHGFDVTREDKWLTIDVREEDLDGSQISPDISELTDEEVQDIIGDTWDNTVNYDDPADTLSINESYSFTWSSQHQFSAGLDSRGDIVDDTQTIWDTSAGEIPDSALGSIDNATLTNDTVTVAGNAVSLGGSTTVDHADLSNIGASDHHTRYADSEAISAINNDADHGSTASHNYFSGDHADLTNVNSSQHHTRYSDLEAISAINNDADHGSTASHNYFSGDHADLSGVGSSDHHTRYSDNEAVNAVEAENPINLTSVDMGNGSIDSVHRIGDDGNGNYIDFRQDTSWLEVQDGGGAREQLVVEDLYIDVLGEWLGGGGTISGFTADAVDGYDVQKNGTDGTGIINFKT